MARLVAPSAHRSTRASWLAVILAAVAAVPGTARATSGINPYVVPQAVDTNPDPDVFETTLTAQDAIVDVGGGVMARVETFNGAIPGPEFHLKVGDTVIVHFENHLLEATGVHWHGIELENASDGTPLVQDMVPPGGSFLYKFKVPRPGTFWYHPHHHTSTNQVFKGMYGPLIVTDPSEAALIANGALPPESQTLTLVLSDITVCKAQGSNDVVTYDPSLPWWFGPSLPLPVQPGPTPYDLCQGSAIDEDGIPFLFSPFQAGDVPNIQPQAANHNQRINEGQTVLTNGMNVGGQQGWPFAPGPLATGAFTYDVQAGQGVRLRLVNAATTRFFNLHMTDATATNVFLYLVGGEGGLLDHAVLDIGPEPVGPSQPLALFGGNGTSYLAPGDRMDVALTIPASASQGDVLTIWTEDWPPHIAGSNYSDVPTVPVMHFRVNGTAATPYAISNGMPLRTAVGASVEVLPPATTFPPDPATFTPPKPGIGGAHIEFTNVDSIDNVTGTHDAPGGFQSIPIMGSTRYAHVGDVLELEVKNDMSSMHPFHLHGFSIQPIGMTDQYGFDWYWAYTEFRDVFPIPEFATLRFRVRIDDRPLMDGTTPGGALGRWFFHCHIFPHAAFGMLSELDVVDGNGNAKPFVHANVLSAAVNEGQTVTVTGTYQDPDGDPVTLSASIGTVTDTGSGTWSWSFKPLYAKQASQYVYVTATDSNGNQDQAAFYLTVNNLVPHIAIVSPKPGTSLRVPGPLTVTAAVSDPGPADRLTCVFSFDGGGPTVKAAPEGGLCSATNTFVAAGVYTVTVTVIDGSGASASDTRTVPVQDPTSGAVAGTGTMLSPPFALAANPKLSGTAAFALLAGYVSGAPAGLTAFTLLPARLTFLSSKYDWLVVTGASAQWHGSGTVNGAGSYGFLLTVTDGQLPGGGGVDRLRLKLWDQNAGNAVVYDNAPGAPDDLDVASPQPIKTGDIVIKK